MTDQQSILEDLPPGPTLVHRVLQEEEEEAELTQQEIIDETMLNPRTVRWALERLVDEDLVESRPNPRDARQDLYSVTEEAKNR